MSGTERKTGTRRPQSPASPTSTHKPTITASKRAQQVFQTSIVVNDRNEKHRYHDYVMQQISNGSSTIRSERETPAQKEQKEPRRTLQRPASAPMARPRGGIPGAAEANPFVVTSHQLLQEDPSIDKADAGVEHYAGSVKAVKMGKSDFPEALRAQGCGHAIIQPNNTIHRYHTKTDLTFETGIRPSSAGNNPRLIATAQVATPPYPATCGRRSCYDHYFYVIDREEKLGLRKDFTEYERTKKIHNPYANYESFHGKQNATAKVTGYRMINPNMPLHMHDPTNKTIPFFIHTTRDAAIYNGLPTSNPLF